MKGKPHLRRLKLVVITASGIVLGLVVTVVTYYKVLWLGGCRNPEHYQISTFRGRVVGRSLGVFQYRWVRRQFTAAGTTLTLSTFRYARALDGSSYISGEPVGERVIDSTGAFDFGDLVPGEYQLNVAFPREDSYMVYFAIDPKAHTTAVLIDASPRYYCECCGWEFEPH